MSNRFRFEAETRLIRWGESSAAGRTITLELPPDDGASHPFRGFPTGHTQGQRFRMQFDAIADDEQTNSPAGAPSTPPQSNNRKDITAAAEPDGNARSPTDASAPAGGHKERQPWDTLPLKRRAGILCSDKAFQKFVSVKSGWECDEEDAASWLRIFLGINSRKDLDHMPEMAWPLEKIRAEFLEWAGRVPVPVR